MNIFFTSQCPKESALYLDDIRANKMFLESCQLLSTAMYYISMVYGVEYDEECVYKKAYVNHPCTKWTWEATGNFSWLLDHAFALSRRVSRTHKSQRVLTYIDNWDTEKFNLGGPDLDSMTSPPLCVDKDLKIGGKYTKEDAVKVYRKYMMRKWNRDSIKLTWNTGIDPREQWSKHHAD